PPRGAEGVGPEREGPGQQGGAGRRVARRPPWGRAGAAGGQGRDRPVASSGLEQNLDRPRLAPPGDCYDGPLPLGQREAVGYERGEVEAGGDEVEVVLEGVLAHARDVLHAEGVGADDPELLEVQRRPLEAGRRL